MKTTIDIADDLIDRARLVQKRDDVTLRALVEEGLRLTLERHAKPAKPYKFVPIVVGEPWHPGMPVLDVNAMIVEDYEERIARNLRVAEPEPPAYAAGSKRTRTRKRK